MRFIHIAILFLLPFASPVMAQSMQMEIIPLHNRTVEDVIPVLRSMVIEGGTVTGMNNQLIVKSTPGNLAEIREILQSLDRPTRRLMIYVRQDVASKNRLDSHTLSGRYKSGDVTIASGDRRRLGRGTSISINDNDGNNLTYRNINKRFEDEDKNLFHVQTLEGRAAFIQTGQSVPFAHQNAYVTHGGVIVQDTIEYRDMNSGFYVLPRLAGDNVTLLISPQLAGLNPAKGGVIDVQKVDTTVSGRLGQWISVGVIDMNSNLQNRRNLTSTRSLNQENRNIELKVVEIP